MKKVGYFFYTFVPLLAVEAIQTIALFFMMGMGVFGQGFVGKLHPAIDLNRFFGSVFSGIRDFFRVAADAVQVITAERFELCSFFSHSSTFLYQKFLFFGITDINPTVPNRVQNQFVGFGIVLKIG